MIKTKNNKLLILISSVIFALSFIAVIVLFLTDNISGNLKYLFFALVILAIIFGGIATFLVADTLSQAAVTDTITEENEYAFGKDLQFYNVSTFSYKTDVFRFLRANRKKEQYVIAFTATSKEIAINYKRNRNVIEINNNVANILVETFSSRNISKKHYVFGFERGTFYIFLVSEGDTEVNSIIEELRTKIYNTKQDETDITIWVEPMFGVVPLSLDVSLVEQIENAVIARNISEQNFEPITFYHESFRQSVSKADAEAITQAIKNDEFVVYYQPKFNINTNRFTSSEALVRWNSKEHGLLPPSKFIPLAESAGLIHEIDTFVFKRVCEDLNETKRKGRRLIPVSVNFSLYEFFSTKFLDTILEMLDEYKIDPGLIQIEITETTSQTNQFLSVSIIKKLQERGIMIAMDDFGVGFSNIGTLQKIPFNIVKIDKSFIDGIETSRKSADIVKHLIELFKVNDLEVCAEGVDNQKQVELLKKFKCDVIQGYYFSKPLSKKEYFKFLMINPFENQEVL